MSDFVKEAVSFLRVRAAALSGTDDWPIGLAAHLFAIASRLALLEGSARMTLPDRRPPFMADVREGLEQIAGLPLPPETDARSLYWTAVHFLNALDAELFGQPGEIDALPSATKLDFLEVGAGSRVYHWLRPVRSYFAELRRRGFDGTDSGPDDSATVHPGASLRRLTFYWQSDWQSPELVPPRSSWKTMPLVDESGPAAKSGTFRIALCPLAGGFHPLFEIAGGGELFRALRPPEAMAGRAALHEHLGKLVAAARRDEVHLLVLPELMVDPPALEHLRSLLRSTRSNLPHGVVAGSFHVWPGDREGAGSAAPVNESVLLDHRGRPVLVHRKRGRFRVLRKDLAPVSVLFPGGISTLAPRILEDIGYGSTLQFLETSLGRLVVLICADASEPNSDHGFGLVVERLRPDLLMIVSMTPETEPFEEYLRRLQRMRIGALFVNAHCICDLPRRNSGVPRASSPEESPLLACCDLALYEPAKAAPTRLQWRYQDILKCCYHHGRKDWHPAPQDPEAAGAALLEADGESLGLVLDVGVHGKGFFT